MATVASRVYWCTESGCTKHYLHRQSLRRHRERSHKKSSSVRGEKPEDTCFESASLDEQLCDELLQLMDSGNMEADGTQGAALLEGASSVSASRQCSPTARAVTAVATRAVAPMKGACVQPSQRRLAADRIARRWRPSPTVSTDAVYGMLTDMASFTPFAIAAASRRRLQLTERQQCSLRRRLSAAALTERRMVTEVRDLLPLGPLDGNSAMVAVTRLHAWIKQHNKRPAARVNE